MAATGAILAGCTAADPNAVGSTPDYAGSEIKRLSEDLVNVRVEVNDAMTPAEVSEYADCVAANYALTRDFAFARHVRTTLSVEGSLWLGDAVYTMSPALPEGLRTIDAQTRIAACLEAGIPTV